MSKTGDGFGLLTQDGEPSPVLFVIIDQQKVPLNKIKTKVVEIAGTQSVQPEVSRSAFKVSIADIIPFVNSGDLLRYLPQDRGRSCVF